MEFKALKTILCENSKSAPSSVPAKLESKQKNIGKRSLANAISFSSTHYGNDDESSIHKIRKFTLESVSGLLDKIQRSIEEENELLDKEILRLNTELLSQSDNVFGFCDANNKDVSNVVNNNQSPGDSNSSGVSSPRTAGVESTRGGRFRSRLNSVRDELFFLEDF